MNGYAGKILRLDLTKRKITTIPTSDYEQWGGGHGMGSAIFFDLVKDKTIDGFDPANVVTVMTSPLCGTLVPAAGGRTEVQGIGVQSYPIGWFTRSNFGGRFSSQLKYAGWDGIVIEGRADEPVWVDIRDGDVQLRNCEGLSLWGKDTRECQETIWDYVAGNGTYGDWIEPRGKGKGQTAQRPAVLAIGPAGENLSRLGCLIHDASCGAGQGGFGGVWGSKRLKAISVIGTGSIHIHDPKALLKAWIRQGRSSTSKGSSVGSRVAACVACDQGCKGRYEDGLGNEATCEELGFYWDAATPDIHRMATDLLNRYGLNAFDMGRVVLPYVRYLRASGELGPGKAIDCPLDFDDYGSLEFVERFVKTIAYRSDGLGNPHPFGDDLAEGIARAAKRWGLLDAHLESGRLPLPFWGLAENTSPGTQPEWDFGSVLGDRDITEHDIEWIDTESEEVVRIVTDKMAPFQGDRLMLDSSRQNRYSEHFAKLVSWHRYYTRFYKQSLLFCDWRWPQFVNRRAADNIGPTGEAEPAFLNAVTGKEFTFLDGIELGRKIWNLDHAIWTLQGRHRDMVRFAEFIYKPPGETVQQLLKGGWTPESEGTGKKALGGKSSAQKAGESKKDSAEGEELVEQMRAKGMSDEEIKEYLGAEMDSSNKGEATQYAKSEYSGFSGPPVDRDRFEEFKTRFYTLQGWDTESGFPKRSTLADMGLGYVADELETQGKLGV